MPASAWCALLPITVSTASCASSFRRPPRPADNAQPHAPVQSDRPPCPYNPCACPCTQLQSGATASRTRDRGHLPHVRVLADVSPERNLLSHANSRLSHARQIQTGGPQSLRAKPRPSRRASYVAMGTARAEPIVGEGCAPKKLFGDTTPENSLGGE
eukprot:scaffold156478_cov28-Tisochrysis_lutea.AAC.2